MVEQIDFALGLILGVVITSIANYLTEKWRERKERKSVARALITELEGVKKCYSGLMPYKMTRYVFSTVLPKLLLFKEQTIKSILETYREIDWKTVDHAPKNSEIKEFTKQIDDTIELIRKELDC